MPFKETATGNTTESTQEPPKYHPSTTQVEILVERMTNEYMVMAEIMEVCGMKNRKNFRLNYILPAISDGSIERKIPAPRIPTGECFVFNRSYRNRRIGDFLKELHITEGRSTGFPKIYRALKKNDSPLPVFETDEHNQYFLATIKIHEAFIDEDAYLKKIGKEREMETKNVQENVPNDVPYKLTERQRVIYGILKSNVPNNVPNNVPDDVYDIMVETAESLASKLSVSTKSIKRDLKRMKELGIIKREGGNFGGHWEIIK